ncbi:MAG: hypothetical protein IKQ87_05800 [Clostridia bacterium]|nr:hypothetical protein [Clostridia bacterium]
MRSYVNDEYHFDPRMEEAGLARESAPLPADYAVSAEDLRLPEPSDTPEYGGKSGGEAAEEASERHSLVKRLFLIPVTATIAAVSVLFASMGYDPLKFDVFSDSPSYSGYTPGYTPGGSPAATVTLPAGVDGLVHLIDPATGEMYVSSASGDAGLKEAVDWLVSIGRASDQLRFLETRQILVSRKLSDDAIFVGDIDDPDNLYILSGEWIETYRTDCYYEVVALPSAYSDSFPVLDNLDPDFAGNAAWANQGEANSEEYLILHYGSKKTYLVAGGYYRSNGVTEETVSGASYDRATNTLTLSDFREPSVYLEGNLMGNGFTIRLEGTSEIRGVMMWGAMYGGSLTFTGTGSVVIGRDVPVDTAILLQAERSASALMIDRGVTVEIYGQQQAFVSLDSTLDRPLYYLQPQKMEGGLLAVGSLDDDNVFREDDSGAVCTVIDPETGTFARHVRFSPD